MFLLSPGRFLILCSKKDIQVYLIDLQVNSVCVSVTSKQDDDVGMLFGYVASLCLSMN